jgi:hypothetical protein
LHRTKGQPFVLIIYRRGFKGGCGDFEVVLSAQDGRRRRGMKEAGLHTAALPYARSERRSIPPNASVSSSAYHLKLCLLGEDVVKVRGTHPSSGLGK